MQTQEVDIIKEIFIGKGLKVYDYIYLRTTKSFLLLIS